MTDSDDLRDLEFLSTSQAKGYLSEPVEADPVAAVMRLRKTLEAWQASAVLKLQTTRRRLQLQGEGSQQRLPHWLIEQLLATDAMAQQASSYRIATYKAHRLAAFEADEPLIDLCCGMGVDAIAQSVAGLEVEAVDLDPAALLATRHHASLAQGPGTVHTRLGDARELDLTGRWVHLDPQRRNQGQRSADPREYLPPLETIHRIVAQSAGGVVKLSPACPAELLADWPKPMAWQYVSEARTCKQLLGWWGRPAQLLPPRSAVVLTGPLESPQAQPLNADAPLAPLGQPGPILFEPDPAVVAAGAVDALADRFGLHRAWAPVELLFGPEPIETPLARRYHVLADCPGRTRDAARALTNCDAGIVEVKPVGLQLDTDKLQRQLRGRGNDILSLFWIRIDRSQQAYICRRITDQSETG